MSGFINLTGQKFGRLTVIKRIPNKSRGNTLWLCECLCGNKTIVQRGHLRGDYIKSCGCFKRESHIIHITKHGRSHDHIYKIWNSMIQRCNNVNNKNYDCYGGRGIKVCERWLKFENFLQDMGEKPDGYSIDRIDNNSGYCPENCRWNTTKEQSRNNRRNIFITIDGETQCLKDWCSKLHIKPNTISTRIANGMKPKDAILKPVRNYLRR